MNPVNSDREPWLASVVARLSKPLIRIIHIKLFHLDPLKSPFHRPLYWVACRVFKPEFMSGWAGRQVGGLYNLLGCFLTGSEVPDPPSRHCVATSFV